MQLQEANIKNWRVLIVDDVMDNRLVAEMILDFQGATVETANNGIQALELLESYDANLILLDLSMPGMDGWQMLEILHQQEHFHHIPIIALTAHVIHGDKQRVMDAGFNGYIAKPYEATTFVGRIQEIMNTMHNESV